VPAIGDPHWPDTVIGCDHLWGEGAVFSEIKPSEQYRMAAKWWTERSMADRDLVLDRAEFSAMCETKPNVPMRADEIWGQQQFGRLYHVQGSRPLVGPASSGFPVSAASDFTIGIMP
jgi:hypothetical protein